MEGKAGHVALIEEPLPGTSDGTSCQTFYSHKEALEPFAFNSGVVHCILYFLYHFQVPSPKQGGAFNFGRTNILPRKGFQTPNERGPAAEGYDGDLGAVEGAVLVRGDPYTPKRRGSSPVFQSGTRPNPRTLAALVPVQ